jgi:hypothetical protein
MILSTTERILNYLDDSLPAMKGSEFLKFITDVKRMVDFSSDIKEERKEESNFDWLFMRMEPPRLINLSTELDLV